MYGCACLKICGVLFFGHLALVSSTTTQGYAIATTTERRISSEEISNYERVLQDYDQERAKIPSSREGRGMNMMPMDYDHDPGMDHGDHDVMDHDDHHEMHEQKAVKEDPWAGYYDFIINEGSFKFWAVFQLATAILLIYSAFAAVYYAKFNVITTDYDYYDDFFGRSSDGTPPSSSPWLGLSSQTFQRIFNALSSKKYS